MDHEGRHGGRAVAGVSERRDIEVDQPRSRRREGDAAEGCGMRDCTANTVVDAKDVAIGKLELNR